MFDRENRVNFCLAKISRYTAGEVQPESFLLLALLFPRFAIATPVYVHSYDLLVSYLILSQEPGPFLILILDKTLVTEPSSMILIVLGQNHNCLSATSQESAHQVNVLEPMMLECAVSHVRMTNSSY